MKRIKELQVLFTYLLLCNIPGLLYGQNLKAQVVDEAEQPIEYANVVLLSLPDSTFIKGTANEDINRL